MSQALHAPLALFGGPPVCTAPWPSWPIHDAHEEQLLLEVLRSGQWWYGEKVRQFEEAFAAFQGAAHAVTATNGTTAIEMGLRALGVLPDAEVIVPPYSFVATASAVVTVGAIPRFADIDPDTLCLAVPEVERLLGPRTKAIIPVHVGGRIADADALRALATRHGVPLLEDAAHAWGSQWDAQGAGTLGAAGTFSFQVSKNITAGEGGVLVTNDAQIALLCWSFSHCGRIPQGAWYEHPCLGSNLRLTEFQAAVLLAQLQRLPEHVARRAANARLLDSALEGIPGLRLLRPEPRMTRRSYHMYIFRLDASVVPSTRQRFLEALNAEGVPASPGWHQPLYRNGLFSNAHHATPHGITAPLAGRNLDYRDVRCPVCEAVCRDAVWLPHQLLLASSDAVERAALAIAKVAAHAGQLR